MKCKDCKYLQFESAKDGLNRYRCDNPEATKNVGYKMVCRCDRHSNELKVKNSPKWCPLKNLTKKYYIRKDVDLDILKQFPFEDEDSFQYCHTNADASKHFQVWKSTREISFINGHYAFGDKLFNMLVKANLVEEVSK